MPVVVLMRHAEAEPMKTAYGQPLNRPLTSRGRVQADAVAWRIACSFGHAITSDELPGAETSKSGRTGVRAATDVQARQGQEAAQKGATDAAAPPVSTKSVKRSLTIYVDAMDFDPAEIDLESLDLSNMTPGEGEAAARGSQALDPQFVTPEAASARRKATRKELEEMEIPKSLPVSIWSSPALRCLETAEPLAKLVQSKVEVKNSFNEHSDLDVIADVLLGLPPEVSRIVVITHQPQVESALARLGLSQLGPVNVGSAFRLLLDNGGRLISARKI